MHKNLPNFFIFLDQYNSEILKNKNINIGVIYRNYSDRKKEIQLQKIASICKKNRFQLYISNDIKLVHRYKADGLYIPSFNKTKNFDNLDRKNITILGSAHNQKEIQRKIQQKCVAIFLSPLFQIEKAKRFLGLHKFNYLSKTSKVKILPLGGINEKNINKLKLVNTNGFGGIRIFKKKPAYKRPVFIKNNLF